MKTNNRFILSVITGAAAGALFGFLFTTKKGQYFREDVTYSAKKLGATIREKSMDGVDMIAEKTSDITGRFRTRTEDIGDEIKGGFEKTKSTGRQNLAKREE
ncbi:MAG: YtxH domain-containing protein [Bacteroidota bacterium]|nr:YtxH domain-containing protein [Bacteroidota bacterium]